MGRAARKMSFVDVTNVVRLLLEDIKMHRGFIMITREVDIKEMKCPKCGKWLYWNYAHRAWQCPDCEEYFNSKGELDRVKRYGRSPEMYE